MESFWLGVQSPSTQYDVLEYSVSAQEELVS